LKNIESHYVEEVKKLED
jgi:hypothetical protein